MMKVKYVVVVLLCFFLGAQPCLAQRADKLFDKYGTMDRVTLVYISKAMFQMMPSLDAGGLSLGNMTGKIESLQILTTEDKKLGSQISKEFSGLIGKGYEELMRVRDGTTSTQFYMEKKGERVHGLLMLSDLEDGLTVMQLRGNFTLKDIQEIVKK